MTWRKLLIVCSLLIAGFLYGSSSQGEAWWLKCPLFQLTGWQCPLCGLQRAVHAFLHGDLLAAWRYNPALWLLLPYVGVWLLGSCSDRVARSRVYAWATSSRVVLAVILLLCMWGVARNVWG
jgi:hypothetical protein